MKQLLLRWWHWVTDQEPYKLDFLESEIHAQALRIRALEDQRVADCARQEKLEKQIADLRAIVMTREPKPPVKRARSFREVQSFVEGEENATASGV